MTRYSFSVPMFLLILLSVHLPASNAEWNTQDYFKREHSLLKPYLGELKFECGTFKDAERSTHYSFISLSTYFFWHCFTLTFSGTGTTIPYWDYVGSTMVTSNYVRLTSDDQSRQGGLWNIIVGIQKYVHFLFCMVFWYDRIFFSSHVICDIGSYKFISKFTAMVKIYSAMVWLFGTLRTRINWDQCSGAMTILWGWPFSLTRTAITMGNIMWEPLFHFFYR